MLSLKKIQPPQLDKARNTAIVCILLKLHVKKTPSWRHVKLYLSGEEWVQSVRTSMATVGNPND